MAQVPTSDCHVQTPVTLIFGFYLYDLGSLMVPTETFLFCVEVDNNTAELIGPGKTWKNNLRMFLLVSGDLV